MSTYMIRDKLTPQLRERFLEEIKKSEETGEERGFHLCIEKDGKLSSGNTFTGDENSIRFHLPRLSCSGRKTQGDFHTHTFLSDVRKKYNITISEVSDKRLKEIVMSSLRKGYNPTTPSHQDVLAALLDKCTKMTNGTTCIGSDLDMDKVECWTIKNFIKWNCIRAFKEKIFPIEKGDTPHKWVLPLFNVELIDLKKRYIHS
jgi:hypothetical protein